MGPAASLELANPAHTDTGSDASRVSAATPSNQPKRFSRSGFRGAATTWCWSASSTVTSRDPTYPVAPVTKIRIFLTLAGRCGGQHIEPTGRRQRNRCMEEITGGRALGVGTKTQMANLDPSVAAVAVKFPPNLYSQEEI